MNKKLFSLALGSGIGAFAAIMLLASLNGCGQRNSVAVVNGDAISLEEYYEYLENKPEVTVVTENGSLALPVDGALGFQAMRDLIGQQIELQIAKDKGCYPSSSRVEEELRTRMKQNPNYLQNLLAQGITLDVVRKHLTHDLAQECLQTQGVTVTTDDANKYIKDNPKQFVEPEKVDLSLVYVANVADEEKVDSALASGQSFNSVALSLSQAPTAKRFNGHLTDPNDGPVPVSGLAKPIQDAIKGLREQRMTDWLQFSNGYAKLFLEKRYPERPLTMDAAKIELVRRELAKQEGQQKNDIQQMILDKLKKSSIQVNLHQYQDTWRDAFQQLKTEK